MKMTNSGMRNGTCAVPLPETFRRKMESAFQFDFSGVRVRASAIAEMLRVPAFTVGAEIFLGPDAGLLAEHDLGILFAHELAHVVQQATGQCSKMSYDELEADAHADAVVAMSGGKIRRRRRCEGASREVMVQCWGLTSSLLSDDIRTCFPKLKDETLLGKFARMGALLEDQTMVKEGLQRLESALDKELLLIRMERENLGQKVDEKFGTSEAKFHKVLKRVLEKEEGKYGFNAAEGTLKEKVRVTLTGIVPMEDFNKLLKMGYHWKDPGAGTSHGEYAHRIQWYIYTTSSASNGSHSLELFKAMANQECLTKIKTFGGDGEKEITMWDFILDCFMKSEVNTPESDSARAPACLTQFIEDNAKTFPVLCAYLNRRNENRFNQIHARIGEQFDLLVKLAEEKKINVKDQSVFQPFAVQYLYQQKFVNKFKTTPEALQKSGQVYLHPKST